MPPMSNELGMARNIQTRALISPHPLVFEYTPEATRQVRAIAAHTESCRTIKFLGADGAMLLSGSADKSILATDSNTGQAVARLENAHASGVNALIALDESNIATGTFA
eukprot:701032-Prorocentrum_minimum.AAC.5